MDVLPPDEAEQLLRDELVGHLGVIADGLPYVTPVSYVTDGQSIAFRTGRGRRSEAIGDRADASFEVSRFDPETGDWRSVVVSGVIERVTDDREIQSVVLGLLQKYADFVRSPMGQPMPPADDVVLRMSIDEMTGRTSGSFFLVRTRPGRL